MQKQKQTRPTESGFTLVEALCAIVILAFGLMAVTNLLLVAASSNSVANQSSAATASASQAMDAIRATSWTLLVPGGSITADVPPGASPPCNPIAPAGYHCNDDIPGVGLVHTRWAITDTSLAAGVPPGDPRTYLLQVRSEGTGALAQARSRADFTMFLSCGTVGCPAAP